MIPHSYIDSHTVVQTYVSDQSKLDCIVTPSELSSTSSLTVVRVSPPSVFRRQTDSSWTAASRRLQTTIPHFSTQVYKFGSFPSRGTIALWFGDSTFRILLRLFFFSVLASLFLSVAVFFLLDYSRSRKNLLNVCDFIVHFQFFSFLSFFLSFLLLWKFFSVFGLVAPRWKMTSFDYKTRMGGKLAGQRISLHTSEGISRVSFITGIVVSA